MKSCGKMDIRKTLCSKPWTAPRSRTTPISIHSSILRCSKSRCKRNLIASARSLSWPAKSPGIGDKNFSSQIAGATSQLDKAAQDSAITQDSVHSLSQQVDSLLTQDEPAMRQYTAHLVGHAHIDFQWLWEWPETVQVCHDTFNQAIKFMDEFPGFKFTQSSSGLYEATEKSFPDLFKKIQEEVAKGNWEIVGGRVCEGDENMLSPESHASQFLYGQRYFREHFNGKDAKVGWEPDTFGHTIQFPQILNLAGCKYFYFCRGGYNNPLFWWQAPDGSRCWPMMSRPPAVGTTATSTPAASIDNSISPIRPAQKICSGSTASAITAAAPRAKTSTRSSLTRKLPFSRRSNFRLSSMVSTASKNTISPSSLCRPPT